MFLKQFIALGALSALTLSEHALARPLDYVSTRLSYDVQARDDTSTCAVVTITVTDAAAVATNTASVSTAASAATASTTLSTSQIGDFGSCTVPEIEFGVGFDGRKETSFQPVDQTSYNHGSAQNINIITQFMCNTLTNSCGANALAKTTCSSAAAAASAVAAGSGAQADAFNAIFGISTNFAVVPEVNDQGVTVSASATTTATSTAAVAITSDATASVCTVTITAAANNAVAGGSTTASAATASPTLPASQIGDFGSCSIPQIEFGTGFDGRRETAFQPVNQTPYNHGSADNINVITQFMCDALTNTCGANDLAKTTCTSAASAASAAVTGSGAQADAFNAVFGISTDFAAVAEVSNTGVTLSAANSATSSTAAATSSTAAAASSAAVTASSTAAVISATSNASDASTTASATTTVSAATSSSTLSSTDIGNFGSCSVPEIEFSTGFDGRKETAYQPVDLSSYNHGSADGIAVITSFICGQVSDACGANALAKTTCSSAAAAASSAAVGTGAQADAFNAVFGISTNFAAVPEVNDQGQTVTATATASA